MSNITQLIKSLEEGILPDELDFTNNKVHDPLDWDKIRYNAFYKSPDFVVKKLGENFLNLPAGEEIVQKIAENLPSPLEEMNERQYGLFNNDLKDFYKGKRGYEIDGIKFYDKRDYNEYIKQKSTENI